MKNTNRSKKVKAALLLTTLLIAAPILGTRPALAAPITTGTNYVIFYLDKQETFLNGEQVTLDAPATVHNGRTYVPAKFLGDAFGMNVEWQEETKTILMETPSHEILLHPSQQKIWVNGLEYPFDEAAMILNGRLLIKLTWLSDYMGAKYTYNHSLRRVDVIQLPKPEGIYIPDQNNSKPVAKFVFGKSTYRIGEKVTYKSLSYDPDAEAISLKWEGKEETFFEAGTYPVTLSVVDINGNWSEPFTRHIVVENEVYLSEIEYPIYTTPIGGYIPIERQILNSHFTHLPNLSKHVTLDNSRTLLVSDSPETFSTSGILYQDTISGQGRLYADHLNGTQEKIGFAILATNHSDQPVQLRTTKKGEVYPSIYAQLIGSEAMVDYLIDDSTAQSMMIPAGETFIYKQFPDFYPGQGVNLMYDVEMDGELQFTFAAAKTVSEDMLDLPKLPFQGHVRGTFQSAGFDWKIDATKFGLQEPKTLVIGDGVQDTFLQGYDPQRGTDAVLSGNYGAVYQIHGDNPRKMAIMLVARGGTFKGPFKINGEMIRVPESGALTPYDGMVMLYRTTGNEKKLEIEFSPPAGSSFPIHVIFYPLDDRE